MGMFTGKKGVIMGVANDRSLTWGIAKILKEEGAELAFSYQPGILESRVRSLAESVESAFIFECDGEDDISMHNFFEALKGKWTEFDFLVNGMAFANKEELTGRYVETSREGFLKAMSVSCYAFTHSVKLAQDFMKFGGSCLTLSYYGAEKWMPHYNVMGVAKAALECSVRYLAADMGSYGVRVNAISSGPVRTLAAAGIGDFRYILDWCEKNSPMRQNTTIEDVGRGAAYLLSSWSGNVTGEILHIDGGYNIVGMKNPELET